MNRPSNPVTVPLAQYSPQHFLLGVTDGVATVTLNRPERKNPLTFESYRELTDFFRAALLLPESGARQHLQDGASPGKKNRRDPFGPCRFSLSDEFCV